MSSAPTKLLNQEDMKAIQLIKHIQSQIDLYGDCDIEVSTLTQSYTEIKAVQYNIFGTIEIVINK